MTLQHDSRDRVFSINELLRNGVGYFRLVAVVFGGIAVRTVDHDGFGEAGFAESGFDFLDVLGGVIWARGATSTN